MLVVNLVYLNLKRSTPDPLINNLLFNLELELLNKENQKDFDISQNLRNLIIFYKLCKYELKKLLFDLISKPVTFAIRLKLKNILSKLQKKIWFNCIRYN